MTGQPAGQGANNGIAIEAMSTIATGELDYWQANGDNLPIALPSRRTKIRFNTINGAYYGVSLSGAEDCIVVGNALRNNGRNVSVQNRSLRNKIAGNALEECYSSSVLLAYGSCDNDISGNFIRSTRAGGEAILNNYIGSKDNRFQDNVVEIDNQSASPAFFCYAGVHADRVEFARNTLSGNVSKAGITVESAWNTAIVYPYSHAKNQPSYLNGSATGPTDGIVIRDNRMIVTTPRPGIALVQAGDGAGGYALTNTIVDGNLVEGNTWTGLSISWEDNASWLGSGCGITSSIRPTPPPCSPSRGAGRISPTGRGMRRWTATRLRSPSPMPTRPRRSASGSCSSSPMPAPPTSPISTTAAMARRYWFAATAIRLWSTTRRS